MGENKQSKRKKMMRRNAELEKAKNKRRRTAIKLKEDIKEKWRNRKRGLK